MQFGKDYTEGKYDWKQEGRQQLLLPSEYKKAVSAKAPAPVISWHAKIISCCWKIACRCVPQAVSAPRNIIIVSTRDPENSPYYYMIVFWGFPLLLPIRV